MPEKKGPSNLTVRLLTAAVMVPVILYLLFWAPWWGFLILVFAAAVIAGHELMAMTIPNDRVLQAVGVASTVGVLSLVRFVDDARLWATGMIALVAVGLLAGLLRPDPIERAGSRIGWLIAGPLYVGGLVGTIANLHALPHGGSWVVLSMTLAWLGDTGGYFAGRAFGRHKLYEKVSPKKTVEGSFGGLAGSVVGALLASLWYLTELPLWHGIVLAVIAGALGQAGDLCESLIKRSCGVKDSGGIVPGHGGILDRIDALMFTAAATWVYAAWLLPG